MKNAPLRHNGVGAPIQRITNRFAIMHSGVSFQKTEQRLTRKGFTCWKSKTNTDYRLPDGGRDLDLARLSVKSRKSVFLKELEKRDVLVGSDRTQATYGSAMIAAEPIVRTTNSVARQTKSIIITHVPANSHSEAASACAIESIPPGVLCLYRSDAASKEKVRPHLNKQPSGCSIATL